MILRSKKIFLLDPRGFDEDRKSPNLQAEVANYFDQFQWSETTQTVCPSGSGKLKLHPTQRFGYHYFTPFNRHLNGYALIHTAGAGKTIAAMLIASVFVRAGRKFVVIAPDSMTKDGNAYLREAFLNGTDFNVQEYLVARDVKSITEAYLIEHPDAKEPDNLTLEQFGIKIWKDMKIRYRQEKRFR